MEIIDKYPDLPWDWEELSISPYITIDFIKKYMNGE